VALGGVLAAVLAGCADETKTVTGDTSATFVETTPSPSVEAAPTTTRAAMAVPGVGHSEGQAFGAAGFLR
jgi:hypothetical protein